MKRYSIRWRLPLTYAAIASLTALTLGAALLTGLREYYAGQERDYMARTANAIARAVGNAWTEDVSVEEVTARLRSLAFFPFMRLELLDTGGQVLVDTGEPQDYYIVSYADFNRPWRPRPLITEDLGLLDGGALSTTAATSPDPGETGGSVDMFVTEPPTAPVTEAVGIVVEPAPLTFEVMPVNEGGAGLETDLEAGAQVPLARTAFGFSVGERIDPQKRSDQTVTVDLHDAGGALIGSIRVSGGPAIGSEILSDVRREWLVASAAAVLVAVGAGWVISRRISAPILSLTEATTRMADGDLSVRADIPRRDEVGQLAAAFNTMANRVENTVTTLQRFVADAAHELHTPLTVIRADLELIDEARADESAQRSLTQVLRLQALADDLLTLSRIESGRQDDAFRSVDLAELTQALSAIYASQAEQADIDFALEFSTPAPLIPGDREQLERMVSGLLDNAVKFTPSGGTITVTLVQTQDGLVLTVQDTGIGIPDDDLPLVFERFRRGRNTARYPGSGLGLAIVKAIVGAHGGIVNAENTNPGVKITVSLSLEAAGRRKQPAVTKL